MENINLENKRKKRLLNGLISTGALAGIGLATFLGAIPYSIYKSPIEPEEIRRIYQIDRALNRTHYNIYGNLRKLADLQKELPNQLEKMSVDYKRLMNEREAILLDESFPKIKKDYESKMEEARNSSNKILGIGLSLLALGGLGSLGMVYLISREILKREKKI